MKKVQKTSSLEDMKTRYRALSRKYDALKYKFIDHISWEDFEILTTDDFLELKETYLLKKNLYWEIHKQEKPGDHASEQAYRFLNSMPHNEQVDFLMKHELTTHELINKINENPNFIKEVTKV